MSLGKIVIVGAGAIGSYYGARLLKAGEEVHFLLRSDYEHVKAHGLEVRSTVGDFSLDTVPCAKDAHEIGAADLVIIAWKTTANQYTEDVIRPLLKDSTTILTLQNGLGNCELLAETFGAERVIGGLCFVCINRLRPGVISHTASGLIRIGEFMGGESARLARIAETFVGAEIPCEAVSSLEKALWMKLVWNFPFNGLAIAEGGVDTEVLLKERGLEGEIRALMQEVIGVAAALGHHIPERFIEKQLEITYPMGKYRPSSMIDYVEGRPVEFNAIWEKPLETAREVGVPVPHMEDLAARIEKRLVSH